MSLDYPFVLPHGHRRIFLLLQMPNKGITLSDAGRHKDRTSVAEDRCSAYAEIVRLCNSPSAAKSLHILDAQQKQNNALTPQQSEADW